MPNDPKALPQSADLYGELQLAEVDRSTRLGTLFPGIILVAVAALAALWLSEYYGVPTILIGLLIGLSLSFANSDPRMHRGLDFSSKTLLRLGIVLIGFRITFGEIVSLGAVPFIALIGIMLVVIVSGIVTARLLKKDILFGLLAGGATAICGVSAALALWGVIGEKRISQTQFTIVLLGTTIASAIAMTFYPVVAGALGLSDRQAGYLMGAAVHDVAQSIGGGYSYSAEAGDVAAVVKLSRVAVLPLVLVMVSTALKLSETRFTSSKMRFGAANTIPWFLAGFIIVVAMNSLFELPAMVNDLAGDMAKTFLLLAVIAAAIKTDISRVTSLGLSPFGPVLVATGTAFLLSLAAVGLLD